MLEAAVLEAAVLEAAVLEAAVLDTAIPELSAVGEAEGSTDAAGSLAVATTATGVDAGALGEEPSDDEHAANSTGRAAANATCVRVRAIRR